jgi:hypothetical protein
MPYHPPGQKNKNNGQRLKRMAPAFLAKIVIFKPKYYAKRNEKRKRHNHHLQNYAGDMAGNNYCRPVKLRHKWIRLQGKIKNHNKSKTIKMKKVTLENVKQFLNFRACCERFKVFFTYEVKAGGIYVVRANAKDLEILGY